MSKTPKRLLSPRHREHWILLLISLLTMLICTKSSPLYPMNSWVDSNAIFTVGKSIFRGKVIYRDLFDHKGPILHFIFAIGSLFSFDTFFGIWLMEIVACYIFLYFSYRTLCLFADRRAILLMPVYAVIVYSTRAMCEGGSAEEFCLPMVMYAIYVVVKSMKEQKPISRKEFFAIGISSAMVLWIKYLMLGLYIGWVLIPFFLAVKEKKWAYIRDMFLFIMAGVLAVSLVVISYFLVNGAVGDLFQTYFFSNLSQYQAGQPAGLGFIMIILYSIYQNWVIWLSFLVGCIWLMTQRRWLILFQLLITAGVGLVITYFRFTVYFLVYYAMIFSGFGLFGFIPLFNLLKKPISALKAKGYALVLVLMCLLILPACFLMSGNSDTLLTPKEEIPQHQLAQIISEKPNATVLNYHSMDLGIYNILGIVPECRYFCIMNLNAEESRREQTQLLETGTIDFIVTQDVVVDSPLYELRKSIPYTYGNSSTTYYLYERKAEN